MSCIILSNEEMKYEIDGSNHPDWLNKGPWYNTDICSSCMENILKILFHMQEQIDIISCVLFLHMIKKPSYEDK